MVSVVRLHPSSAGGAAEALAEGLDAPGRALIERTLEFAEPLYAGKALSTGEPVWPHGLGLAGALASVGADAEARSAGILFAAPKYLDGVDALKERFGSEVAGLAAGVERLYRLRVETRGRASTVSNDDRARQTEVLRKMVIGMVEDVRIVLIRLASRTQTLRWYVKNPGEERDGIARESLEIYSPLANRLGVWQLKWELEDLSFRILEPDTYSRVAGLLHEKRAEREIYIADAIAALEHALGDVGVTGEVLGRPKHIYSIWNKMRSKSLSFDELYDVRALRVIVGSVADCYAALGVVHNLWEPVPKEFDDYISRPKGNHYQSLHTAVIGPAGRTLEVQIRTREMHRFAELGVAAHWRYKEAGRPTKADTAFDDKIAWLRQLLAWRDEVADGLHPPGRSTVADAGSLIDDTVFVLTPQGRVVDLPAGSTPIDFAYALHTDVGHRCRGAKVDGAMVPLDTVLANGQRVEIVVAKSGGPSRDWLNPERGFATSHRARAKIRQWFNAQALDATIAEGRAIVEKEIRREHAAGVKLDALAEKLGHASTEDLFAAAGRDDIGQRQIQAALRELAGFATPVPSPAPVVEPGRRLKAPPSSPVLIVGMEQLLTQLAKCCKPVPPDPVRGFVTRGRGVSLHRADCRSLAQLAAAHPERIVEASWGASGGPAAGRYAVDISVVADDRQGLLRDIGDALARERINVTAVNTRSRAETAYMRFSFEIAELAQLQRAFAAVKSVPGVVSVARG